MPYESRPLPPAADLWERYSYNPLTGELFSRKQTWKKTSLGSVSTHGYKTVYLEWHGQKQRCMVHRLVWKWVKGADPTDTIDHINRNKLDNCIGNLRVADWQTQMLNRDFEALYVKRYGKPRPEHLTKPCDPCVDPSSTA